MASYVLEALLLGGCLGTWPGARHTRLRLDRPSLAILENLKPRGA